MGKKKQVQGIVPAQVRKEVAGLARISRYAGARHSGCMVPTTRPQRYAALPKGRPYCKQLGPGQAGRLQCLQRLQWSATAVFFVLLSYVVHDVNT
jgi:hypothetical protein